MAKSLYICYFGIQEPLVQTQVIPYLRELMKDGVRISLLTFEPVVEGKKEEFENVRKNLESEGIKWNWLKYHKRPSALATAYDIVRGTLFIRNTIRRERPDVLHGRVHVPTLMGALGRRLSGRRPKLLFDIRGFFPEEYTDAGVWPENGWLYRAAKRVEKWLLREADGFVVLTERAREILFPESAESGFEKFGRPVEVIPCCVDLKRFLNGTSREDARQKLGVTNRFIVTYVGSFGGWYMTDEMMSFFETARRFRPDTFAMVLTQRDKDAVKARLKRCGFSDEDFLVESVKPAKIADYLIASDVAVSFIKACYSKQSSSPTKIAEYLVCGLPVVANPGVGDVDTLITANDVGTLIRDFKPESYEKALNAVEKLGDIGDKCRETSIREFDLETVGGRRYRELYRRLLGKGE